MTALLLTCSDVVKSWALEGESLTLQKTLQPHQDVVNCCKWNHNNQVVASCSKDGTISLSHHQSEKLIDTLPSRSASKSNGPEIRSIDFSGGSRYLCSGGADKVVNIWDLKKRAMIRSFRGHTDTINSVTFNYKDEQVASGSQSGDVLVHNVVTGQVGCKLSSENGRHEAINAIQYSMLTKHLLGACRDDGSTVVWDVTYGKLYASFPSKHDAAALALTFSPVNRLLLCSAGLDKRVLFYDVTEKLKVKVITAQDPLTALTLHHDGYTLATGSATGMVSLYDLRGGSSPISVTQSHFPKAVRHMYFSHKEKTISGRTQLQGRPEEGPQASPVPDNASETSKDFPKTDSVPSIRSTPSSTAARMSLISPVTRVPSSSKDNGTRSRVPPAVTLSHLSERQEGPTTNNNHQLEAGATRPPEAGAFAESRYVSSRDREAFNPSQNQSLSSQRRESKDAEKENRLQATERRNINIPTRPKDEQTSNVKPEISQSNGSMPLPSPPRHHLSRLSSPRVTEEIAAAALAAAKTAASTAAAAVDATSASAPQSHYQRAMLESIVEDKLEEFRERVTSDVRNLHLDMLRQFQLQMNEINATLDTFTARFENLITENERLRRENELMKNIY